MKQKHYMDIERLKPAFTDGFEVGDEIVIQEKIDGSCFSIRYDSENNIVKAFSRKTELNEMNNLRGAYEWSQKLDVDLVKKVLGNNLVLFGEYLVKHTVVYPEERYNNVYCFDVYDISQEKYLPQSEVENIVAQLGLIYVPDFYVGKFISWEHIKSFIGRTDLGGEYGEGVVVKNQTKLNNSNTKLPFYVKLVAEKFCETKGHKQSKAVDVDKVAERERQQNLAETIVTEARVRKLINKMIDDGILREDWDCHDMKIIAQNLGKATYNDCIKEEPDIVNEIGNGFGKIANSTAMRIARQIMEANNG